MTYLDPGQLVEAAQPMDPREVRDVFVRAYLDGEFDAPDSSTGYATVRHGLAKVIPLVLAQERAAAALLGRTIDAAAEVMRSAIAAYQAGDAEAGMRIIADHVAEVDGA